MSETVKVLEKSINIINMIGECNRSLTLGEISRKLELPKTTAARILNTLLANNFLELDENQKYKLGLQILRLGTSMLNNNRLRNCAKEQAIILRNKTNFTVFVGILTGFEIIYIEKVPAAITMTADIGYKVSAHCTAMGQVLLSQLDEETLNKLLAANTLTKKTDYTITDVDIFRDRLKQVRKQGYALDEREHKKEIRCIAAPIKDHTGRTVAAISISSVASLYDENKMEEYIKNTIFTAKYISEQLGCINYELIR